MSDLIYQQLSAAAYLPDADAKRSVARLGYRFEGAIHDKTTGADLIVCSNENETVVAFRGTEKNYADIMADLKFRRVDLIPSGKIRVHRGFRAQWGAIRPKLRKMIGENGDSRLIFTGHSLGGALAVIAGLSWPWCQRVVTFGAPRVGSKAIKQVFKDEQILHTRYVYGADIVPAVPLMAMGFRHDGRPVYLTTNGEAIRDCPLWQELFGRFLSVFSLKWKSGWTLCPVPERMYLDHKIANYGRVLERAENNDVR